MSAPAEVVRRFLDEVWNARDLDAFPRFVAQDVRFHPPRGETKDHAQYRAMAQEFMASFSDLRFEVERIAAEGSLVAVQLVITGTNDGPFRRWDATGRRVRVVGRPWARVEEGRIVQFWQLFDEYGMLQQLGHVPE